MHLRNPKSLSSLLALATLVAGCAHRLGPETEPPRVASKLGLFGCHVSESMRRYQTLDYAGLIGNPNLAESPEWATAISMMQPGDELRYVSCQSGDNFFGLFRGNSLLFKFGGMLY